MKIILDNIPFKAVFDFKNQNINLKYRFLLPVLILVICGFIMQASISDFSSFSSFLKSSFFKQLIWFSISIILFFLVQYMRIQYLYDYSYLFFPVIVVVNKI